MAARWWEKAQQAEAARQRMLRRAAVGFELAITPPAEVEASFDRIAVSLMVEA